MQLQLCASLYKQRLFKGYNKKAQLLGLQEFNLKLNNDTKH